MIIFVIYYGLSPHCYTYKRWWSFTMVGNKGKLFYHNTGNAQDPWKIDERAFKNGRAIDNPYHCIFTKRYHTYFKL